MSENKGFSLGMVGLLCVSGVALGAGIALLLAPGSGRESRAQLRGYARRSEEHVHELVDRATEGLAKTIERGREFAQETQSILAEAVETGRDAIRREVKTPS